MWSRTSRRCGRLLVGALVTILGVGLVGPAHLVAQTTDTFAPEGSVVYLVRHAETADAADNPQDPPLSDAGRARAAELAKLLADADLTSLHATPFERTRATARAVGDRLGLEVEEYDPFDQVGLERLLESLRSPGRHLVVGHSNTTPGLVSALGGDAVSPVGEAEYDRLYVVAIEPAGGIVSTLLRYGAPSASIGAARPRPAALDPDHVVESTLTYQMKFRGEPAGTATYQTRRDGTGWILTETSVLPSFQVDAVNEVRVGADLAPESFRATGTMFGNAVDIDVAFARDRARGTSLFPRQGGPAELAIDAELPPGTLERTSTFFLAHALPYEEAAEAGYSLGLRWFDTYSGQVQRLVAVVAGEETVTVPAGTFDAWRVELRGGTPSQVLWVSRRTPRRIVRIEVVGQPWVYELSAPVATSPEISAEDLAHRVGIFASDSMRGRAAWTEDHARAVGYIVAELERMGAEPAGDDGSFLQTVPLVQRELTSSLALDGEPIEIWRDAAPFDFGTPLRSLDGVEVVYVGNFAEREKMLPAEEIEGKFAVLGLPPGVGLTLIPEGQMGPLSGAAGVGIANLSPENYVTALSAARGRQVSRAGGNPDAAPRSAQIFLSPQLTDAWFGGPLDDVEVGTVAGTLRGELEYTAGAVFSDNVVAVIPGSDPELADEYVAIGAHSDHLGVLAAPVDGDAIANGADDDASGSMAMLEIAERLLAAPQRPRRSILLVWHTAEEIGLYGSQYFTENPTVPRDAIVAQLNMDMIGRGGPDDIEGGGSDYLQILGSRRLSTGLGDLVEEVNARLPSPFEFDYQYDAAGHPQQYYCRSDHYSYARFGIPIVFFSTGNHPDYHRVSDEPDTLRYGHFHRVTDFIHQVALELADRDDRPIVDQPIPDPSEPCRQ